MTHQTLVDDLRELERDLEANDITESLTAWGADVVRRALSALTGQEGAAPPPDRQSIRSWVKAQCSFCRDNPTVNFCEGCQMKVGWIQRYLEAERASPSPRAEGSTLTLSKCHVLIAEVRRCIEDDDVMKAYRKLDALSREVVALGEPPAGTTVKPDLGRIAKMLLAEVQRLDTQGHNAHVRKSAQETVRALAQGLQRFAEQADGTEPTGEGAAAQEPIDEFCAITPWFVPPSDKCRYGTRGCRTTSHRAQEPPPQAEEWK